MTFVTPSRSFSKSLIGRTITPNEWALMCRQMEVMLKSGVQAVDALDGILENEKNRGRVAVVARQLRDGIASGESLYELFEQLEAPHRELAARIMQAAEVTGNLAFAFTQIAEYTERRQKLKTKLVTLFSYPLLTIAVGLATVVFLLVFVIPRLVDVFNEAHVSLPLPTRVLIFVGQWSRTMAPAIVLAGILLLAAHLWLRRKRTYRIALDSLLLALPGSSYLIRTGVARYCSTTGDLLRCGVPLLEALRLARNGITNHAMARQFELIEQQVMRGETLTAGLRALPLIPPTTRRVLMAAEDAGKLEDGFQKASEALQSELETNLQLLVALADPLIIVGLSLIVGFIAVAVLLPIFELSGLIK